MAIIKNVSKFIITLDDFWNLSARYEIRPGRQMEILDNIYVTSKKVKRLLQKGELIEVLKPQFDSDEVGDWWDKDVRVENIPGTLLDTTQWGWNYETNEWLKVKVNANGELVVDTELTVDEATLNINNVFPARYYDGQHPFEPGTDVLLSVNAYGELELAREYFNDSGFNVSIDASEDSVLSYGIDYEDVPSIWPMRVTDSGHLSVDLFHSSGEPFSCVNPLFVTVCAGIAYNIEYPNESTLIATDEIGRVIRDTHPIHGTNATTELAFNALDQLVRIRKYVKGQWFTQDVTGTDILDATIVRVKTFHSYTA